MFWYLPDVGIYCYNYRLLDPNTGVGPWSGPVGGSSRRRSCTRCGRRWTRGRRGSCSLASATASSAGSTRQACTSSTTCCRTVAADPDHDERDVRADVLQDADAREVVSPHWITATLRGSSTLAIALQCGTGVKTIGLSRSSRKRVMGRRQVGRARKWAARAAR
jgi:hypothetical protein